MAILTIKATRYKGKALQEPIVCEFEESGGTIGRSAGNHLVLPDEQKVVSGRHAYIYFEEGGYFYFDQSTNGTLLINRNRVINNGRIELHDQDALCIGDYELMITIVSAPSGAGRRYSAGTFLSASGQDTDTEDDFHLSSDDWEAPGLYASGKSRHTDTAAGEMKAIRDCEIEVNESFVPPPPVEFMKEKSELPHDLTLGDFFSDRSQLSKVSSGKTDKAEGCPEIDSIIKQLPSLHRMHEPKNKSLDPEANTVSPNVYASHESKSLDIRNSSIDQKNVDPLFDSFAKAIGLSPTAVQSLQNHSQFVETVGHVFNALIDGLMTVLRGRSELKSSFHAPMTIIRKEENNPLKFSPSASEALETILTGTRPGFLSGVEAVREGFKDIMNHQIAFTAGVQASLKEILERFDPEPVEAKYRKGVTMNRKSKCWNEYEQNYQQLVQESQEKFFGKAFVEAYEAQMNKLRSRTN